MVGAGYPFFHPDCAICHPKPGRHCSFAPVSVSKVVLMIG